MRTIKLLDTQADNKVGDTATVWSFSLLDDGSLNYVDVNSKLAGHLTQNNAFVLDVPITGANGQAVLDFSQTEIAKLPAGEYGLEVQYTDSNGKVAKYPTQGTFPFRLELSATDLDEGSMIPVISLTEFQSEMDATVQSAKTVTDKAQAATDQATSAATSATTATTNANKATDNANNAATQASNQASAVSTAITKATTATTSANDATTKAQSATTSANTATTNANSAAATAQTAAQSASNATVGANSAASNANSVAAVAQKVVDGTAAGEALSAAANAQAAVDGLEIGGRNYLLDSKQSIDITQVNSAQWYSIGPFSGSINVDDLIGKTIVISVDVNVTNYKGKRDGANQGRVGAEMYYPNTSGNSSYNGTWYFFGDADVGKSFHRRIWTAYTIGSNIKPNTPITASIYIQGAYADSLVVSDPKLEIGTLPTDYSPAPEDKADDAKVGHLANDQTWAGVNNFNNLQINGQNLDAYIAAQIAKATGTA